MALEEELIKDKLDEARNKAIDSLARYKFQMFGYWASIWVHLNRIGGFNEPNPFRDLVKLARGVRQSTPKREPKQCKA